MGYAVLMPIVPGFVLFLRFLVGVLLFLCIKSQVKRRGRAPFGS